MNLKTIPRLLCAIVAAATFASAQATWMTDNAKVLEGKRLNEIAFAGAHDAGTYGIPVPKPGGIEVRGRTVTEGDASPDSRRVKRVLSFGPGFGDWARTQERTTAEMLADGVRYLDLRVCVDDNGVFKACHGLYGARIDAMLDEVAAFVATNQREVVILGFNHFWDREYQVANGRKSGELEGLRAEKWTELVALVKTKLGPRLVSAKQFTPASKLGELWAAKSNNGVIALFDSPDAPDDEFVWKQREANTWVEGWDQDAFKAGTLKVLETAKSGGYEGKFWAIRSSVTPDDEGMLIGRGFVYKVFPKSNLELAEMTNPVALGWIKNEWKGKYPINFVWCDYYNRADIVPLTLFLNGIKTDLSKSKIGRDTNWSKWKTKR